MDDGRIVDDTVGTTLSKSLSNFVGMFDFVVPTNLDRT